MCGLGYLVGIALCVVGIGDAVARMTVDGWFIALAGVGFLIILLAFVTDSEVIPDGHPDQFGSLDMADRGLQ